MQKSNARYTVFALSPAFVQVDSIGKDGVAVEHYDSAEAFIVALARKVPQLFAMKESGEYFETFIRAHWDEVKGHQKGNAMDEKQKKDMLKARKKSSKSS